MPPRLAVLAIVVFWLASTSWLIYREVLPEWRAAHGQPPAFTVELFDEIGANYTSWHIFIGAKEKGSQTIVWRTSGVGRSEVHHQADRSFVYATVLTFTDPWLLNAISKIDSAYRVTAEGKLLDVDIKVRVSKSPLQGKARVPEDDAPRTFDFRDFGLRAKVEDGYLKPSVYVGDVRFLDLDPIRLPEQSSILNPIQLGNKITGLRAGQTWSVPLLDPLAADPSKGIQASAQLLATVSEEVLVWDNRLAASAKAGEIRPPDDELTDPMRVPCFKIDFRKSGDLEPTATSWVRQRDGLVLQQLVTDNRNLYLKLIRGN